MRAKTASADSGAGESDNQRHVGRHTLDVSSLEKLLFPGEKITKRDLLDYYEGIAPLMLPHLKDRPLSLQRYPGGIEGPGFFQKEVPDYFPDFITTVTVEKDDGTVEEAVCNNAETLVYLANQNTIVFHRWMSRRDKLIQPDILTLDFDPNAGADFKMVLAGVAAARDRLEGLGLRGFPLLTGSRGVHIIVPIKRRPDFKTVAAWMHTLADQLADAHPRILTTEFHKAKRGDRVFVDWLRNQYAQTAVTPYSVRARPGAPVAAPVTWEELGARSARPERFSIRSLKELLRRGDVWEDYKQFARPLPPISKLGSARTVS